MRWICIMEQKIYLSHGDSKCWQKDRTNIDRRSPIQEHIYCGFDQSSFVFFVNDEKITVWKPNSEKAWNAYDLYKAKGRQFGRTYTEGFVL